jgi:leucyl-tRNA synthetase
MNIPYNAEQIEKKWQTQWKKDAVFQTETHSKKPCFYVLEMFPYPSGTLHMGHARNYAIGDVMARYYWANGYNVLHPMGWDACGLPAENAALKKGVHPRAWTYDNARIMKKQCLSLGFTHDWSREIFSCDPDYFCHEQKMFLNFYDKGFAYQKEGYVNWDPVEQSVLANEQVIDGKGWRSGAFVEKKLLKQWFLRITDFAQPLLDDLDKLDQWSESVRTMQKNWIGKSKGANIDFPILHTDKKLSVFTTRPETLFGATFCAVAWDHPLVAQSTAPSVDAFVTECKQGMVSATHTETLEKKGIDLGITVRHPLCDDITLPVYCVNYVQSDYGKGAIFACPAHDQRDFDFAHVHALPCKPVIVPEEGPHDFAKGPYSGPGTMIHSGALNGLSVEKAREKVIAMLKESGSGKEETTFRLRDWGIGRQRYWGVPIPMIHCPTCGTVPVPEKDLPVTLPDDVDFQKTGNPLDNHPTWKHTKCPVCHGNAQRETDTFDTFFESSWYFARFCDPHNKDKAFAQDIAEKWLPVNQYIGGVEHAVMHLLYARFFTKMLRACGYWNLSEPFKSLFTQGMVCHKTFRAPDGTWLFPCDVTKEGRSVHDGSVVTIGRSEKMSKSKCNVVGVTEMIQAYGADAVRLFLLSDTPPHKDFEWTETGIEGSWRYVRRVWNLLAEKISLCQDVCWPIDMPLQETDAGNGLRRCAHKTVEKINQSIAEYTLNKYVAYLREFGNAIHDFTPTNAFEKWALKESLIFFVQMMAPIMPHIAEESRSLLGIKENIHTIPWPKVQNSLFDNEKTSFSVHINGKHRGTILAPKDTDQESLCTMIRQDPALTPRIQGTWDRIIFVPEKMINIIIKIEAFVDFSKDKS